MPFRGSPGRGQQTIRVAAFQYPNALSPQSLPAKRAMDSSLRGVFTAPLTPRFPAGGRLREFLANRPYMPDNVHLKCAIHPSAPSPVGTGIAHARFIANESARKKAARRRLFRNGGLIRKRFLPAPLSRARRAARCFQFPDTLFRCGNPRRSDRSRPARGCRAPRWCWRPSRRRRLAR